MKHLTEKENYMRLYRGEMPEWVPMYSFGPSQTRVVPTLKVGPGFLDAHQGQPGISQDIWGVSYEPTESAGMQKLPQPNNFILDDICKWRDVIKVPDISGIDWEAMAKKDIERVRINREDTALIYRTHHGYFQYLMAFMGFTEGLCAMFEEPDEVKALFEYLCDFYCEVIEKSIDYYTPDIMCLTDDIAAWRSPFISLEMYRELVKPYHARQIKSAIDRGIPVLIHCCGKCDEFIDDWMEMGITGWDPAQTSNDLLAVKEKYNNRFVINGGYYISPELADDNCSEELVRQSVRDAIDRYAPGGGYAFYGSFLGGGEKVKQKNLWLQDEATSYGKTFFNR